MDADRDYQVSPAWALLMADLDINPTNVLRRAGLPADLFARSQARLKPEAYFELCRALDAEADRPNLPLTLADSLSAEAFDPPIFAALCSRNLNEAAPRIAKYKPLIGPMTLRVSQTPDETKLAMEWPSHLRPPKLLTLLEIVFWVALTRMATRVDVRPIRATTPEPPEDAESYRQYLGVSLQRGPERSVTFSAQDAKRPFLTQNEGMWAFFEPELRKRLAELEAGASASERVRAILLERLPVGQASMADVAQDLALSSRTLQRRLRDEGTTFQSVLNDTREDLARHYLTRADIPTAEISFLLGYEDQSSFYRAFREWTGQTPERVRMAAA